MHFTYATHIPLYFMSTLMHPLAFQRFDAALAQLNWQSLQLSYRNGYDPSERIYQVGECEFRVKDTPQGFTDSYGLINYLSPQEDLNDPETIGQFHEKVMRKLEESYRVQQITIDSQRRTVLLQQVWENEILPEIADELDFFQLTNYDLVVKDNSFRLHLGDEPRMEGPKVDDYIIIRGFFYPLEVSIYAIYLNKLFQFFGMLHEPGDKDWDGAMGRVQAYIDRFYSLAKTLQHLLEKHVLDEQFMPPKEYQSFAELMGEQVPAQTVE